jgi:hypothetical protein
LQSVKSQREGGFSRSPVCDSGAFNQKKPAGTTGAANLKNKKTEK